jgi:hypothetical protein
MMCPEVGDTRERERVWVTVSLREAAMKQQLFHNGRFVTKAGPAMGTGYHSLVSNPKHGAFNYYHCLRILRISYPVTLAQGREG